MAMSRLHPTSSSSDLLGRADSRAAETTGGSEETRIEDIDREMETSDDSPSQGGDSAMTSTVAGAGADPNVESSGTDTRGETQSTEDDGEVPMDLEVDVGNYHASGDDSSASSSSGGHASASTGGSSTMDGNGSAQGEFPEDSIEPGTSPIEGEVEGEAMDLQSDMNDVDVGDTSDELMMGEAGPSNPGKRVKVSRSYLA